MEGKEQNGLFRKEKVCRLQKWLKLYLADLLVLGLAWGGYYRCQLADSDTLWGEFIPGNTLIARLTNFRWMGFVFDWISYHVFHYYPFEHTKCSLFLFLAVLSLGLLMLQMVFLPFVSARAGQASAAKRQAVMAGFTAATALVFVNVLFAEHFYFTDAFLNFKSAFFFSMLGCFLWSRKHRAAGGGCIFLASMFYQVTCADAAIVLMTLALLEENGRICGRLIRKELAAVAVPFAAGVLNYASGPFILRKINDATGWNLSVSKAVEWKPALQMIREFASQMKELYESSMGLMIPLWLPLLFSLVTTAAVLAALARKRKWTELWTYVLYKAAVLLIACGLQALESTSDFTPRIICTFYFMQAMNAVIVLWIVPLRKTVTILPVLYVCVQIFFIQIIIANRYLSENLDMLYANAVLDRVEQYEAETGNQVTSVTFCNDENSSPYYPQVHFADSAINIRLYGSGTYSLLETMAQERGRHFDVIYKEQSGIETMFEGKNWDSFQPDEQIVFDGNLVYVCVF